MAAVMVVIVRWLDLQLPVQSVPITTKVVSLNPIHGEVYSIQHYVIKFVSVINKMLHYMLNMTINTAGTLNLSTEFGALFVFF
jgi:hypothetical protein